MSTRKRFNSPFANLGSRITISPAPPPPQPAPTAARPAPTAARPAPGDEEPAELSLQGVRRLPEDPRHPYQALSDALSAPAGRPTPRKVRPPAPEPFTETALAGGALEGRVAGVNDGQLRQLRRGEPSPDDTLDLHGFSADDGRAHLHAFLQRARIAGHRCVLIVHGRGRRSGPAGPVLRTMAHEELVSQARAGHVLAFTRAPDTEGGDGATLVLLRR